MAASFDPSVIGSIGEQPDVAGAVTRGFQLKDLADQHQLNQLNLQRQQRDMADDQTTRKILSGSDLSTDEGVTKASAALTKAGLPDAAMRVRRQAQEITSGQLDQQVQQLKLYDEIMNFRNEMFYPIYDRATEMRNARTADGKPQYNDAEISAFIASQIPSVTKRIQENEMIPAQMKQQMLQGIASGQNIPRTYDQLQSYEEQGTKTHQMIKDKLESLNLSSEISHRGVEERQNQERIDIARQNATAFGSGESDLLAALAEKGVSLPVGLRSRQQIVATLRGILERNPNLSADDIADKIKSGQIAFGAEKKETQTAAAIGGRAAVAENELQSFAAPAIAASNAVPRGKFVPVARLIQMGQRNVSDPDLKELMVRTNAILNAYDVLAARGGTDAAKREEAHRLLLTADSPRAYERAVRTMINEAQLAKGAARAAEGRGAQPNAAPTVSNW